MPRPSVLSPTEAVAAIAPGSTVAFGGALNVGHPMALVRALLAAAPGELTIAAGFGGLDVDIAVAAGAARRLVVAFVGAEGFASLPPGIRWATERGDLETWDVDEGILFAALKARAQYLPYSTWHAGLGTSLAESPLVETATDPRTGAGYLKVDPLPIDTALLWAEAADREGNVLRWGPDFGDEHFANAAETRIVQVERLVDTDVLGRHPDRVGAWQADVIVPAPLGTYPFGSNLLRDDVEWLESYAARLDAARREGGELAAARGIVAELLVLDGGDDAFLESAGVPRLRELLG
ncbi:MAG TPA: CoA-transferase [Solirubrobacterales bacterium]|nr:CoA-transferase [Solirubrobacterales bacterium]